MLFSDPSIRAKSLALLFAATLLSGCAVPLGPGFGHAARQIQVAPAPGEPMRVRLQVADRLVNNGTRDLSYLDVDLSAGQGVGQSNLTVRVDGRGVQLSPLSPAPGAPQRIRFNPTWAPKQIRTVDLDYTLDTGSCACGVAGATRDGIYVADPSAFPSWLLPSGLFAQADWHARAGNLEITVPAEFRVLAAGRERRTTRQGALARHEFHLAAANFPAYVIAGRFQERRVETRHGQVIFWTFQPLDASAAQAAAERLAATHSTYERIFGLLGKQSRPLRIVETNAAATELQAGDASASFPEGVLLDGRSVAQGIAGEAVLELAEYELARIWFGWHARPSAESQILLGRGIGLFAVALAAEGRGGDAARHEQVARLLAAYDRVRPRAQNDALVNLPAGASREQQDASAYRSALFFAALEDLAGQDKFDSAMLRFLKAMSGQELSSDELRSALETATGRDFAAVFRMWLDRPGIPADFRARYGSTR